MRRRAPHRPAAGIQAFPFLAVLLCTTGALVVLLIVFAHHGQCLAAQAKANAQSVQAEVDGQELDWRISQLQQARDKTESQLTDERMRLSHIEDHERRLRDEFERLKTSVLEMQRTTIAGLNQRRQTSAELDQLKNKIAQTEAEVEEARHDSKNKGVCYSVVPYRGPNQTRRRPIYIECNADEVILQPEGIAFKESDFEGPLGPSNPLAAALRAVREQIAAQPNGPVKEEPYPLLLVRPEGIGAYYAARAALVSWGSEFGYELVGADWNLQYPEADAQLRQTIRTVVAEARIRQQELIVAAPRQYAHGDRPKYRASPNGGFERVGGSGGDDDAPSGAFGTGKRGDGSFAGGDGSTGSGSSSGNNGAPKVNPYASLPGLGGAGGTGSASGSGAGLGPGGLGPGGTALAQGRPGVGPGGAAFAPGGAGFGPGGVGGTGSASGSAAGFGQGGLGLGGSALAQGGPGLGPGGTALAQGGPGFGPGGPGVGQGGPGGFGQSGPAPGQAGFAGQGGLGQPGTGYPAAGGGTNASGTAFGTSGGGLAQGGNASAQPGGAFPNGGAGLAPGGGSPLSGGAGASGAAQPNGNGATPGGAGPQTGPYSVAQGGAATGQNGAASGAGGTSSGQGGTTDGPSGSASAQSSSVANSSGGGGSSAMDPSADPSGQPSTTVSINMSPKPKSESLAKKRGRDWGVPDASNRRVGITRPVFIVCAPDRLIILPEQGSGGGKEVPIGLRMQDSIDPLVAGVAQHVKTWGIAGKGLYWRPTLVVEIRPGAAGQYAELKALMVDSGLEVKERQTPAALATAPTSAKTR
jgi:hypothetical protein